MNQKNKFSFFLSLLNNLWVNQPVCQIVNIPYICMYICFVYLAYKTEDCKSHAQLEASGDKHMHIDTHIVYMSYMGTISLLCRVPGAQGTQLGALSA